MANNNHFELTLDTLAPSGSIARGAEYVKEQDVCTIVKGNATFMYVWTDTESEPEAIPTGLAPVAAADSYTTECDVDATYYAHVVLMDDVNNRSEIYTTESITYDKTIPTVGNVSLAGGEPVTTERTITIEFNFDDNLSGPKSYTLSGDLSDGTTKTGDFTAAEIEARHATRTITLNGSGEEEATKTVYVTVTDNSGNTSTPASDTIYLDTKFAKGHIVLMQGERQINGQWTNNATVTVELDLTDADDVTAYRIYGDGLSDGDANWVEITAGSPISVVKTFTSGDEEGKKVNAQVRDSSGNVTTLTETSANLDYIAPEVSIAIKDGETQYVSKVTGFTTKDLVPTVNASISGVASYEWKMNGESYPDGTGSTDPEEFQVDSTHMGEGGESVGKVFTLTVTDRAGNTATSAPVTVYLDTVAPDGSITMDAWYNRDDADHTTYKAFSGAGATASATDGGAGMSTMTAWCSSTAEDTTVPGTASSVAYAPNPPHANIDWEGVTDSVNNYIHIKYVDAVGNISYVHSAAFGVDRIVPADGAVAFTQDAYSSTTAAVNLTFSDTVSGMGTGAKFKIWGGITEANTEASAEWQAIAASKSLTLDGADGIKTVYVKYMDVAGNMSVNAVTNTTELDRSTPSGTLTLLDTDESKNVDPIRNIADFVAHITYTDDELGGVQYKIYGDFTFGEQKAQSITEGEAEWIDFTYDSGKDYKKIDDMFCTSGDGTKTIYIRVKDNAGNVSAPIPATFEYDTTAPEVTVNDVDHNVISKIHEHRFTREHETAHYADETNFTFTPNSKIQAYKVCAYLTQAAATAGNHEDAEIPHAAGSVNMSATGLSSNAPVAAMIKGADFESALNGGQGTVTDHSFDGAHIVVVYVQDLGGTWSQNAMFEVPTV